MPIRYPHVEGTGPVDNVDITIYTVRDLIVAPPSARYTLVDHIDPLSLRSSWGIRLAGRWYPDDR